MLCWDCWGIVSRVEEAIVMDSRSKQMEPGEPRINEKIGIIFKFSLNCQKISTRNENLQSTSLKPFI